MPELFPMTFTWDELSLMPNAAEIFAWDQDDEDDELETLPQRIASYSEAFTSSEKLAVYLGMIGYSLTYSTPTDGGTAYTTGITIRSAQALKMAAAIFDQIRHEYDEEDCPRVIIYRHGHDWHTTPTWGLFELGGDDDVDYCSGQPSCLTDLLLPPIEAVTE